jgi:Zn-dependent M28 family amino/carboxypeptidase
MSPAEGRQRTGRPYASYSVPGEKNPENLIRIIVSTKTANEILKGTGLVIDDYIKKAESGKPVINTDMPSKTIFVKSDIITTSVPVRNVIGIIEGNDPDQVIVLGAHYDHEGMANGYLWNGADDNASGTVGVLTVAKAIMETGKKPEKTIVFALWTAEEKGLLGSRYYVDNLAYPLKNLRLNVNFDMISRYVSEDEPNKVTMTYTSTYPGFKELTEGNLSKYTIGLDVVYEPSDDPPGGSDHRSFVAVGVPVMRFRPGFREEYHTPADEISTLDWDIMEKIIRISFTNVWELANSSW